ncbi:hypothetical protein MMC07_000497 [Pseudocyphellaria aurata]|nr:hypothetical protein [Pseudocyphellaria aurata]
MQFFAATCYLASLVAILVVVTTSLPQQSPGPPGIPKKNNYFLLAYKNCFPVGSINHHEDLELKLAKRDSPSPETDVATLFPRRPPLPCGHLDSGTQSHTFKFSTARPLWLLWTFGGAAISQHVVRIMRISSNGPDVVAAVAVAREFVLGSWTPVVGATYYIQLVGDLPCQMIWVFASREYALSRHAMFCSGALANRVQDHNGTNPPDSTNSSSEIFNLAVFETAR